LIISGRYRSDHQRPFGQFLRALKEELGPAGYPLSAVVSAPNDIYQRRPDLLYDVAALKETLDWITVAAYDLDDPRAFPAHHSPLRLISGQGSGSDNDVVSLET
jgi:hypothetical protein